MTAGSVDALSGNTAPARAPILVLGLGNPLLKDDGAGLRLLAELSAGSEWSGIEFVDGGTQGIALLPLLDERRAILVLDAVGLGAAAGTVHVVTGDDMLLARTRRASTAHEGNACELLLLARLLGQAPERVAIVGVEPGEVKTGIGLTREVEGALPAALEVARTILREMLSQRPCAF
jgi:hydrogenase maturation protease